MMRLRSVGACLIITLGVLVATARNALAWGNEGHQIVCQIAFDRLSPAGKMLLQSIQADLSNVQDPFRDCTAACVTLHPDDGRSMTFQVGCIWPDESRRDTFKDTYEYHFINVSNVFTELSLERDCALLDCAVVGIQRFARYLTLPPGSSREKERRVLAVRFLGHFVGDLHQPLHVGFAEDLGGNTIKVKWKIGATSATTSTDLHAVWDNQILKRAGMTINAVATGDLLASQITQAQASMWGGFDITSWAQESFALAQAKAYTKPDGTRVVQNDVLGDDYFNAARPVVQEQLKKAGVRLANLVEAVAAGTLPVNMIKLTKP
jgi:hypothetical protein